MAKSSYEREIEKQRKALEKQSREAERQNKKLIIQERAKAIVLGAQFAAGFRIMDSEAETVLADILNEYDGNERNYVNYSTDNLPDKFRFSLGTEFEKLQMYGMVLDANLYMSGAMLTITEAAKTYFNDKVEALEKQKILDEEAIAREESKTAEIKEGFQRVSNNQGTQSALLIQVIENQNKQIETLESQLQILKNIFASGEDGVAVQKEIMKILEDNLGKDHPLLSYLADKGGDIAFPALFVAFKAYLVSKGMRL